MSKTADAPTERKMEYVQITQAEEMPVLSEIEKAELLQSLKDAEAQIARGEYVELTPDEIGPWLQATYDQTKLRRRDGK